MPRNEDLAADVHYRFNEDGTVVVEVQTTGAYTKRRFQLVEIDPA